MDWDPVAHWTFDEGSGSTANDSIGTADGTLANGATWLTTGTAVGSGALDPGTEGWVDVPNGPSIEPAEPTISAWIRSDGATDPDIGDVIFEKGSFECDGPSYGLYVGIHGLEFRYRRPMPGEDQYLVEGAGVIAAEIDDFWDGQWHLIALGIPNTPGSVYLSVDGRTLSYSTSWASGQSTAVRYAGATHDQFRIGGPVDPTCGGGTFDGAIDDVRIYPHGQAAQQIGELMPPIPITLELTSTGPFLTESFASVTAHISPRPRFGEANFDFIDPATGAVLNTAVGSMDFDGDISALLITPSAGSWTLRVRFSGIPYVASPDSATVEVVRAPTQTSLEIVPETPFPLQPLALTATVPDPPEHSADPSGPVTFVHNPGPTEVDLGTANLEPSGSGLWSATLQVPAGFEVGPHTFQARYGGNSALAPSESDPVMVTISEAATSVSLWGVDTVQANHGISMESRVLSAAPGFEANATMTFTRVGSATPSCVKPVAVNADTLCVLPALPIGTHQIVATYSGNATHDPSTSTPWTVVVTADTVQATSVGRNYGTFYPVKDGYRDTVTMSGTRLEPLSVLIRIYSPGGSLVKSATLTRASGAYKYAWNGRTSSGALRSAGKYKILQTLTDAAGTRRTFTSYSYISHKKLVTKTAYVTKAGSSISVKGDTGTGSIVISTSGGYAKLTGSYPNGWVGVGYQFSLPSAAVYKAIYFQVYSKGPLSVPTSVIGVQNFVTCPYSSTAAWNESCFDHREGISVSPTSLAWTTTSAHLTRNRHGRVVRGMVSVPAYTHWIYKARIKVVYGVLQ